MPSGASVEGRYECYSPLNCVLHIYVYPLIEDKDHSLGLCGNYNGNIADELTPRNSMTVVDTNTEEPVIFVASWMYAIQFCHYTATPTQIATI